MAKTVTEYIKEFFEKHPNEEIEHGRVVDYVFEHIPKARDPWRAIRKLYQEGWLIKVRKGIYKRIPNYKGHNVLALFPKEIKKRYSKGIIIVVLFAEMGNIMDTKYVQTILNLRL